MIVFRHRKTGDASFLSHIDAMRVLQRTMRRMKAEVRYSEGFVPHMLTYTTTPLPLGVQSVAEYFVADSPLCDEQALLAGFNACAPAGMRADFCRVTDKNPNLAARVTASSYEVKAEERISDEVLQIMSMDEYRMRRIKKGQEIDEEVRSRIFALDTDGDTLFMTLATGNENLRVDSFVESLARFGVKASANDIVRTEQFASIDGKFVAAKEILQ